MAKEDLDKELEEELKAFGISGVVESATTWQTRNTVRAVLMLKHSVTRLDKTSSRLAVVNIVLTVVLGIIGVVQIALMVRGH